MTRNAVKERIIAELKNPKWSPEKIQNLLDSLELRPDLDNEEMRDTIFYAARASGTTVMGTLSNSRLQINVMSRSLVYYKLHKDGYSVSEIGRLLRRDHATVIHSLKKLEQDLEYNYIPVVKSFEKFKKLQYEL